MSLPVLGCTPTGGPTFRSIGRTSLWPATNMYPALTENPPPSWRLISRLDCSVYGLRSFLSTTDPPCKNSELFGNEPLLIRFSNADVSSGGGTVPGGKGNGGTAGHPASTHGVGRNMLFRSHVPVCMLFDVGNPVIAGGRCGPDTKKNVSVYRS